nr:hypothetical protein [Mycolicibacterium malmesburyense]CRL67323.1 hypothetical protein CPGR_00377 [Mycolicibacterium malmesburyense]
MQSNDLFSHPQQPEFVSNDDNSTEPVTNPVFSDRPERGASTPSA